MLDSWMGRGQKGSDAQEKAQDKVGLGSIRRPVIGLALGGGAARGFAHIGIVRTLVAHGIIPNVVVGTSIGAVVGGAYAAGHLDTLEEWARSLQPRTVFSYLDIRLNGSGLIGGAKLAAELQNALGQSLIENLPVKFATVATEVRTGHEIWLTHGPMVDAMRASYALPGIFSPVIGRRPLAGRRCPGQSGAGVGGTRARRGDRHRRQSFQRRLHTLHDDLFPRPDGRRFGIGDAGSAVRTRAAQTRYRKILLRRAHHEA
ncbi:pimeloyl-ACP methyl ester carboxylesterase [Bradyrhizobium sp. AZCC 1678]